jgi:3-hydroxyisobutyrate dehydrogenase-like beta-hydroxyacid dehydrogenase
MKGGRFALRVGFVGTGNMGNGMVRKLLRSGDEMVVSTSSTPGPRGPANVIKLTNNIISLGSKVLIQEAMAVAVKAGVEPMKVFDMRNVSSASRWVQGVPRMVGVAPSTGQPTFTLLLSAKDVGCCLEVARELGVPMTVGSAVS